jgi:hypothetical protein
MRKILRLVIVFLGISFLFTSCSEEVNMIDGFTETAVVYGLLDASEDIHYIRINRAFIGPGNWLDIAKIPDSSYFDAVDATVTEVINGVSTRSWKLKDTIIDTKDTQGLFYAPSQKIYYFQTNSQGPLNDNAKYKLHISLNKGQFEVNGETELVSGITTSADGQNFRFSFAQDPEQYLLKGIAVNVGNSSIVKTVLQVNFEEINAGIDTISRSFDWELGETNVEPGKSETFSLSGKRFYELMKINCNTSNPSINSRRLKSITILVTGGAAELNNYMTVSKPSSSLAQSKPTYTNLKVTDGHRVVGVFSSRSTYKIEKFYINPIVSSLRLIDSKSVIELCTGPITGNLFFCSQHEGDLGKPYYCK